MATRHSGYKSLDEFYTPALPVQMLLKHVGVREPVWEPAPGPKNILSAHLRDNRVEVISTHDNFFGHMFSPGGRAMFAKSLVTNPPYSVADSFVRHALNLMKDKQGQVCLLLPNAWDAAKGRVDIFRDCKEFAMKLVLLDRIRWENIEQKKNGPSGNHAWFVWDFRKKRKGSRLVYALAD